MDQDMKIPKKIKTEKRAWQVMRDVFSNDKDSGGPFAWHNFMCPTLFHLWQERHIRKALYTRMKQKIESEQTKRGLTYNQPLFEKFNRSIRADFAQQQMDKL
jgi:hypothetical protein